MALQASQLHQPNPSTSERACIVGTTQTQPLPSAHDPPSGCPVATNEWLGRGGAGRMPRSPPGMRRLLCWVGRAAAAEKVAGAPPVAGTSRALRMGTFLENLGEVAGLQRASLWGHQQGTRKRRTGPRFAVLKRVFILVGFCLGFSVFRFGAPRGEKKAEKNARATPGGALLRPACPSPAPLRPSLGSPGRVLLGGLFKTQTVSI
jgi:hypothetical protein